MRVTSRLVMEFLDSMWGLLRVDMDQVRPEYEALTTSASPNRGRSSGTPAGGRQRDRGDRNR